VLYAGIAFCLQSSGEERVDAAKESIHNCDNTSQLRNYNKRLKRISDLLGLEKPLSSYVSRHTWATLVLRKGIPVEVISESMEHENETTTRIYLASLGQSVVDRANTEIIQVFNSSTYY